MLYPKSLELWKLPCKKWRPSQSWLVPKKQTSACMEHETVHCEAAQEIAQEISLELLGAISRMWTVYVNAIYTCTCNWMLVVKRSTPTPTIRETCHQVTVWFIKHFSFVSVFEFFLELMAHQKCGFTHDRSSVFGQSLWPKDLGVPDFASWLTLQNIDPVARDIKTAKSQ